MSNFIPIVSSSPPPMDDSQSFGWEDDDDDFGNFASAPAIGSFNTNQADVENIEFDADWSQPGSVQSESKESSPDESESNLKTSNASSAQCNESSFLGKTSTTQSDLVKDDSSNCQITDDTHSSEFADFEKFSENFSTKIKPIVGSLPLENVHQDNMKDDEDNNSVVGKVVETIMEKSRESACTDSGVFSTDISPIPGVDVYEESKIVQSEDETSGMPQGNEVETLKNEKVSQEMLSNPDLCEKKEETGSRDVGSGCEQDIPDDDFGDTKEESEVNVELTAGMVMGDNVNVFDAGEQDGSNIKCNMSDSAVGDNPEAKMPAMDEAEANIISSSDQSVTISDIEHHCSNSTSAVEDHDNTAQHDGDDWAAFETSGSSPSFLSQNTDETSCQNNKEPVDLVLRKDSLNFDNADVPDSISEKPMCENGNFEKQTDEVANGESEKASFVSESSTEVISKSADEIEEEFGDQQISKDEVMSSEENVRRLSPPLEDIDEEFGDFSATSSFPGSSVIPSPLSTEICSTNTVSGNDNDLKYDDINEFMDSDCTIPQSTLRTENNCLDSEKEKVADKDLDDFGVFSSREIAIKDQEEDGSASLSVKQENDVEDDDDFGDFNSSSFSSVPDSKSNLNNAGFGAFSATSAAAEDTDDFGDFSGQSGAIESSSSSGWANFNEPVKSTEEVDEFGSFAETKPEENSQMVMSDPAFQNIKGNKFESSLKSCFPSSAICTPSESLNDCNDVNDTVCTSPSKKSQFGMLETILEYGLHYRSASQQTWQVVQHPSKKDPRVKLWSHLQELDGSPAVIYQWGKSSTNSHLFLTLHIDTQNMLIGHKKPSVPIFATGLSLLEPIRGGKKDRGLGARVQADQAIMTPALTPTLVDPSQQEAEKLPQEIPAVDFDWSTSGLTNPLTSKSLDLDFLVAQDSHASDKPSVFQSEILDAPRSSVKLSQPLEDILKSVKPTCVRSRYDDAATSHMSAEAVRVLAGLPDLTFMQSKVLMFPIKN